MNAIATFVSTSARQSLLNWSKRPWVFKWLTIMDTSCGSPGGKPAICQLLFVSDKLKMLIHRYLEGKLIQSSSEVLFWLGKIAFDPETNCNSTGRTKITIGIILFGDLFRQKLHKQRIEVDTISFRKIHNTVTHLLVTDYCICPDFVQMYCQFNNYVLW